MCLYVCCVCVYRCGSYERLPAGVKTLYADGVLVDSAVTTDFAGLEEQEGRLLIGAKDGKDSIAFHGDLEEIYVFNRALSGSEIESLARHEKVGLRGAALYYSMHMAAAQSYSSGIGWKRCYRRIAGQTENQWHAACSGYGWATILVLKTSAGDVLGGYTTEDWNPGTTYGVDRAAFLFSLTRRFILPVLEPRYATYRLATVGPSFGASDLSVAASLSSFGCSPGTYYPCRPGFATGAGLGKCGGDLCGSSLSIADMEMFYKEGAGSAFEPSDILSSDDQALLNFWVGSRTDGMARILDESGNGNGALLTENATLMSDDEFCFASTFCV